jgi:hypothetical protein
MSMKSLAPGAQRIGGAMRKSNREPELITLAAAARQIGLTAATVARLCNDGLPQVIKLGGRRYLPRRAFKTWLEKKLGSTAA